MLEKIDLLTKKEGLYEITEKVEQLVKASKIKSGLCLIFCPHTTAAITINENADPDVKKDLLSGLAKAFPEDENFLHFEGNSAAHLKSSAVGCSELLIIEENKLVRGCWQGIYFAEFDGPRKRSFYVKLIAD